MNYKTTHILPDESPHPVKIQFEMLSHEWSILERSKAWADLQDFHDSLLKKNIRLSLEEESKILEMEQNKTP